MLERPCSRGEEVGCVYSQAWKGCGALKAICFCISKRSEMDMVWSNARPALFRVVRELMRQY